MEGKNLSFRQIKIRQRVKAFTLIELLATIAVVGVLSGLVFVRLTKAVDSATDTRRKVDVATIEKAILLFSIQNNNALPSTDTSGMACSICSNNCFNACAGLADNLKAYLPNIPTDPSSVDVFYKYTSNGGKYTLQSVLGDNKIYQYDSLQNSYAILSGTQSSPISSIAAGPIMFNTAVILSSAGVDAIYYTTDGSTPTASSYNQALIPLVINSAITVKAMAVKSGYVDSAITSVAYVLPCGNANTIVDSRNSKTYNLVLIGSQCWTKENMDYNNGCQAIGWVNSADKGWCGYYAGGPFANEGLLYQWSVTMNGSSIAGAQGICPFGWHVTSDTEWEALKSYLGGYEVAGAKLRPGGSAGFMALMPGYRQNIGVYYSRPYGMHLWSSTPSGGSAFGQEVPYVGGGVYRFLAPKEDAKSVRCLKNQ